MITKLVLFSTIETKSNTVISAEGDSVTSVWLEYTIELENEPKRTWTDSTTENVAEKQPSIELLQALMDAYGEDLARKTIIIDMDDADGNVVQVR